MDTTSSHRGTLTIVHVHVGSIGCCVSGIIKSAMITECWTPQAVIGILFSLYIFLIIKSQTLITCVRTCAVAPRVCFFCTSSEKWKKALCRIYLNLRVLTWMRIIVHVKKKKKIFSLYSRRCRSGFNEKSFKEHINCCQLGFSGI